MSRDKVIARVRKLLALSRNNPSEAEALAAAEQARQLMLKHDLEVGEVGEEHDIGNRVFKKASPGWHFNIAAAVCEWIGDCELMIRESGRRKHVMFIGTKGQTTLAEQVTCFFIEWAQKKCREHIKQLRWVARFKLERLYPDADKAEVSRMLESALGPRRTAFQNGCSLGIASKLLRAVAARKFEEARKEREARRKLAPGDPQATQDPGAALVARRSMRVKEFVQEKYKDAPTKSAGGGPADRAGYTTGLMAPMPNALAAKGR